MNTKQFELTQKEFEQAEMKGKWDGDFAPILEAQVAKVLSLFEPVELEALEKEEVNKAVNDWLMDTNREDDDKTVCEIVSQATIKKNQKGQLYRVKEVR